MVIENYKSESQILEFNFTLNKEEDKIILNEMLSSVMMMKFQQYLDDEKINNLKLKQYSFKYNWNNKKEEIKFIEI